MEVRWDMPTWKLIEFESENAPMFPSTHVVRNLISRYIYMQIQLRCILDFERSRNQRQGAEFFLGKWN